MNKCKNCEKEYKPLKDGLFCTPKCYRYWWSNNLKHTNPEKYRERLDKQSKKRREEVRQRLGIPLDTPILNPYIGQGYKFKEGYKYLHKKDHPNASKAGYVAEHVVIMVEKIGRPLNGKETVHHKNGIRDDNRIENLELWSHSHPFGQRVQDKIEWCKEFLALYGYDVIEREQ